MQRSEQKQATRETILDAATRLLAEQGYAELRVASVASKAGVSIGGLLHHFASKDDLLVAVLERLSEAVLELVEEDASRDSPGANPLDLIAASARRFFSAPEFLIYLDIFLSVRRHTPVGDTAIRLVATQRDAVEALWLPHLTQRGVPEETATLAFRAIWGLARGLAISSSRDSSHEHDQATMSFVSESLSRSLDPGAPLAPAQVSRIRR